jgi:hypothetical protein
VFDNIKLSLRVERGEGEGDAMSTLFKWTNSDSQRQCLLTCNFFFVGEGVRVNEFLKSTVSELTQR